MIDYTRPQPGTRVEDLETPCLLIDLDAVEHNANVIAAEYAHTRCRMRQHAKNIKSPVLAHLQIRAGGTVGGVCVAKVAEAEVMAEAGITDILITSQIGSATKTRRIAALAAYTDIKVAVDDEKQLRLLSDAAAKLGSTVGVIIEVDTSMGRGGVRSPAQGAALAKAAAALPGIAFRGVMSHQTLPGTPDRATRFSEGRRYIDQCLAVRDAVEAAGIRCEIVSTGESWTYDVAPTIDGITEIQGGTYFLMGANYAYMSEFRMAMTIMGTVVSAPRPGVAIGDVGTLALAAPLGVKPVVVEPAGVEVEAVGTEHIVLRAGENAPPMPGDRFFLNSGQPDICVSRWDRFIAVRNGLVEAVWDIPARGCHH